MCGGMLQDAVENVMSAHLALQSVPGVASSIRAPALKNLSRSLLVLQVTQTGYI